MSLPDDTLEYWGFYLLKGATVHLKVCSRYEGSRILVVRGERNLRTCGLYEHNQKKFGAILDEEHTKVKVIFETPAQEIESYNETDSEDIDVNTASEDLSEDTKKSTVMNVTKTDYIDPNNKTEGSNNFGTSQKKHHRRHIRSRGKHKKKLDKLKRALEVNGDENLISNHTKRQVGQYLDGKIHHGGTALEYIPESEDDSSVSSFETGLLTCYDGSILLTRDFPPSHQCKDVHYLAKSKHMVTVHEVASDGYYYYIFYSDNDIAVNDVHAVFDIYKPTYQYNNVSKSGECMNMRNCTFSIPFFSDRVVVVEIPTHDGIEREDVDGLLISTCEPRMLIYMVFPIAVMFSVLACAFL